MAEQPAGAIPLSVSENTPSGVADVVRKSVDKWLKNTEVVDILNKYKDYAFPISKDAPVTPPGGTLFLFQRKQVRFFRKDGHCWRKKPDGKTVRETHEKLKVDNQDVLNCYYAHAEEPDGEHQLQRRCYWLLEGDTNIVLVHYLNIPAEAMRARPDRTDEQGYLDMANDDALQAMNRLRMDPASGGQMCSQRDSGMAWNQSMSGMGDMGSHHLAQMDRYGNWVNPAARRMATHPGQTSQYASHTPNMQPGMNQGSWQSQVMAQQAHSHNMSTGQPQYSETMQGGGGFGPQATYNIQGHMASGNVMSGWQPGMVDQGPMPGMQSTGTMQQMPVTNDYEYWQQQGRQSHPAMPQQQQQQPPPLQPQSQLPQRVSGSQQHQGSPAYLNQRRSQQCSPMYSSSHESKEPTPSNSGMVAGAQHYPQQTASACQSPKPENFFEGPGQRGATGQLEASFRITDFSPSWDYTSGGGKVLITGTAMNVGENMPLAVVFGDTEVPAIQLQPGVLRCQAPPGAPGEVAMYITRGGGNPCSSSVAFKYTLPLKDPPTNIISSITTETSDRDLQVRLVSRLLKETGGSLTGDDTETQANIGEEEHTKLVSAAMARVCLLDAEHAERVLELLLERELKVYTQQVIEAHESNRPAASSLINHVDADGMGLIHLVSALGYEWAVELLLASGASESLKDPWGLTPLHWAAAKGHEDVVALLLRNGASCHALSYSVGSFALFRKRHRNSVAHIGESAPEAEVEARHISEAAREAAERIYLAHGTSASMEVKSTWNESAKSIDALAVGSKEDDGKQNATSVEEPSANTGLQQDESTTRISKDAPELYQALNRVDAIVHSKYAREQYIRMRQAAERNQVSIVPSLSSDM
eukprot:jgi/Tetstr1/420680/TSEL_011767.t1